MKQCGEEEGEIETIVFFYWYMEESERGEEMFLVRLLSSFIERWKESRVEREREITNAKVHE